MNIKLTSLLFFLSFIFSFNLSAQITVDGNPADWANFQTNYPTNAYSHDANNSNDNQFTQGSKDGNAISTWAWSNGQTNNKGDITNAAAVLTNEGGVNYLSFAGDRAVNNGDAAIGFWFFKTGVGLVGTTSGTFSGSHANGDLLVVSHFTQGGGQADIYIYMWSTAINGLTGPVTSSNAAVNSVVRPVPAGFSYASANYPIGDFFEGKISLSALHVSPCFTNFLLETRNSQSITASLQDLTFGSFTQTVSPPQTVGAVRCGNGSVTLTASGCDGGTLKWYDAANGGNLVNTGSSYTLNITSTVTFYVSCTTADGCVSARTSVTATKNENPTVVANATPAGSVSLASAPPHYLLSTTVNGVLNNPGYNYSWVQDPPEGANTGTLSATNIANPSFTANSAGTFTWTVTATDKVTGCFNSSQVTRTIAPGPGCPTISDLTVCAGGTGTITASAIPAFAHYDWSIVAPANGATITSAVTHDVTSINILAGTAPGFSVKVRVTFDNPNLGALDNCTKPVTVNPNAAPPDVTYLPPSCTENTFSVKVNNPEVGSTYTLTQLDGNVVVLGPYVSGDLVFTGLHIGQGFSLYATTGAGCKSNPNECGSFSHALARGTNQPTSVTDDFVQKTIVDKAIVIAAPNPFTDKLRFTLKAPVSGQGSLDLYNMLGQKVKNIYQGYIEKGIFKVFEYNVPFAQRSDLIYVFRIADQKISGTLIGLK